MDETADLECIAASKLRKFNVSGQRRLETLEKVFGYNLKKLRGKRTQPDLAHQLGVSVSTVARWEGGHFLPEPETRGQLALILGVPETALFLDPELSAPTAEQVCDVLSAALQNPASRALLERVLMTHLPTLARKK